MIRNVLRCLNEAKFGPLPDRRSTNSSSTKNNFQNQKQSNAQTATLVDINSINKDQEYEEMINIGDVLLQTLSHPTPVDFIRLCNQNQNDALLSILSIDEDILINKKYIVDRRTFCVNQLNKFKRVSYVSLNADRSIISIYFEDYVSTPHSNWVEIVQDLKQSNHERLVLLGEKIEEFKNGLQEFERRIEEEFSDCDMPAATEGAYDASEEKLVQARLRKASEQNQFANTGGLYVKRDYKKGKGYYCHSIHITKSLIDMIGWDIDDYLMETALTKQHPECILTEYYYENLLQTLECIKYSFLQEEYTSNKENISLLHKSSQIFEAKCEVLSVPKTGDYIMRIEIPETLSFSDDSDTLQLYKKPKPKKFTASEKEFIESYYSNISLININPFEGEDQDALVEMSHKTWLLFNQTFD